MYDLFRSKYGLLNDRANMRVFADDNSYPLLSSLEILAEDGTLERKADMFSKRTIKAHEAVTSVDTASEALSISLAEKAKVDMDFMSELTGNQKKNWNRSCLVLSSVYRKVAQRIQSMFPKTNTCQEMSERS